MPLLHEPDALSLEETSAPENFKDFLKLGHGEILCVPDPIPSDSGDLVLASETYRFKKWVRRNHPEVMIDVAESKGMRDLRSGDYWFPLVFLASDVALPIYLNLISSYIYDMARGALAHDTQRVHLEAIYQDSSTGVTKKFVYKGPASRLNEIVEKIDVNRIVGD